MEEWTRHLDGWLSPACALCMHPKASPCRVHLGKCSASSLESSGTVADQDRSIVDQFTLAERPIPACERHPREPDQSQGDGDRQCEKSDTVSDLYPRQLNRNGGLKDDFNVMDGRADWMRDPKKTARRRRSAEDGCGDEELNAGANLGAAGRVGDDMPPVAPDCTGSTSCALSFDDSRYGPAHPVVPPCRADLASTTAAAGGPERRLRNGPVASVQTSFP
jgi:hypothetical protein